MPKVEMSTPDDEPDRGNPGLITEMRPPVRYAASGKVQIAYQVTRERPIAVR